ncbi:holin [Streptomyces sp. NPDC004042]|uniref:holin n=1 Tax=Streptomyces sp. NPDC004042 TaxID=3154451 RepID=UPI0033BC4EE9
MDEIRLPAADTVVQTAATYGRDLAERTVATFVGAACAVGVAAGPADMFHATFWETMGAAGLAAVFSLLKGLAARAVGQKNSASSAPGV